MAINTTTITGDVFLPSGAVREKSYVIFEMTGFDTDADSDAVVVPYPIRAAIGVDGSISQALWPNVDGVRATFYHVTFEIYNGTNAVLVNGGQISVPATGGPYDLNDLLAIAPPDGASVEDYIAYLAAAVAQAEAAGTDISRAEAVSAVAAGWVPTSGTTYFFDGLAYLGKSGATDIPDIPGVVPAGDVNLYHFAEATGVSDYAAAINAASLYLVSRGGGTLNYPGGVIPVGRFATITGDGLGSQYTCVQLRDTVRHKGAGRDLTTLRVANAADAHAFFGNNVSNLSVSDMTIDGNRDNQTLQNPSTGNDPCAIIVTGTVNNLIFEHLNIKNTCDYGIGFEGNMLPTNCRVSNIRFENIGADAFDSKTAGDGNGNIVENIYCAGLNPSAGQAIAQTVVNPRNGWSVNNVWAEDLYGDQVVVRFNADLTGLLIHGSVSNVVGIGRSGAAAGVTVLMADTAATSYSGIHGFNLGTLVLCRNREQTFTGLTGIYVDTGIKFSTLSGGVAPERNIFSGVNLRGGTLAIDLTHSGASSNQFMGTVLRGGVNGIAVASGANDNQFLGGSISGMSGVVYTNAGLRTAVRNVTGIKTVAAGTVEVLSGSGSVVVTHGLVGTPVIVVAQGRGSNEVNALRIDAVGATTFTIVPPAPPTSNRQVFWKAETSEALS